MIYRDQYNARGMRVRTVYLRNHRSLELHYRPVRVGAMSLYVYNARFNVGFYSRFPRVFRVSYPNYWFLASDAWYYRYQRYYPYRATYLSPSQWLLDYYYSDLLRDYQEEIAEQQAIIDQQNQMIQSQMPTTVRGQLETQVQNAMANPQASSSVVDSLRDPAHLYVVSEEVNVQTQDGQTCSVTRGDVLQLANDGYASGSPVATLQVVSAKDESCDAGSAVTLSVDQLQEFENAMSSGIDEGLDAMSTDSRLKTDLNP